MDFKLDIDPSILSTEERIIHTLSDPHLEWRKDIDRFHTKYCGLDICLSVIDINDLVGENIAAIILGESEDSYLSHFSYNLSIRIIEGGISKDGVDINPPPGSYLFHLLEDLALSVESRVYNKNLSQILSKL